ncbi:hypothetical protein HaLaN_20686 [Haematococcus lacustris]|uniref:Uncharacterized protein n=1 Tax=Haematococcus lacustris TaxID=44745 RepID=A0A699ZWS0_HAELA|nr:hypothetical protein HaLaN_20686 [Haematococcus lacustris]
MPRILAPGTYTVHASAKGFKTNTAQLAIPQSGAGLVHDFMLSPVVPWPPTPPSPAQPPPHTNNSAQDHHARHTPPLPLGESPASKLCRPFPASPPCLPSRVSPLTSDLRVCMLTLQGQHAAGKQLGGGGVDFNPWGRLVERSASQLDELSPGFPGPHLAPAPAVGLVPGMAPPAGCHQSSVRSDCHQDADAAAVISASSWTNWYHRFCRALVK